MKLSDRIFADEEGNPNRNPDGTFASAGGDQSGSGGSDDTTSEKPKEKGKFEKMRDEHLSEQKDLIKAEIKDWEGIAERIGDNMPDVEKKFEYRRAKDELDKATGWVNKYKDSLYNLLELNDILKDIDVFDTSARNKSTHQAGKGVDGNPLNTQYASDTKVDPKSITKATVRYSGKERGLDLIYSKGFVMRKLMGGDKMDYMVYKKDVDEIFNGKTIMHGGNHIRSKDPEIAKQAKAVIEMWDEFSDEQRIGIDEFNIKVIDKEKMGNVGYVAGTWGKRRYTKMEKAETEDDQYLINPSSLSVTISDADNVDGAKHTMLHESSHKTFDDLNDANPENVKNFEDGVIALGKEGAITEYSASFFDKYEEFKKEMADPERLSLTTDDNTLSKKRNLIANEFHSEFISGVALPLTTPYHSINAKNVKKANDLIKELYKNAD